MPIGDKSKYTDKQERKADHIAEGYEKRGVGEKEAERRAWATVNKDDGGGKKPGGSGRGKSTGHPAAHKGGEKGGAAAASRSAADRSASAKKAARDPQAQRRARFARLTAGCGDPPRRSRRIAALRMVVLSETTKGVAWVTGAGSGIGRGLAHRLAAEGWTVAASARTARDLDSLAAEVPGRITSFQLDVTDEAAVLATGQRIAEALGPVDLAILNAGSYFPTTAENFSVANFRKTVDVNLMGVVNCMGADRALDGRPPGRPHRHHGLADRLCRPADRCVLWRHQGGAQQHGRGLQAPISSASASPSP